MGGLLNDIRFGVRMLLRSPLFTIAAVLCLALGIGAIASIFPFFYEFLIDPLPFEKSKELVVLDQSIPSRGYDRIGVSYPDYLDWRERNRSFSVIAAHDWSRYTLTEYGDPERFQGARISHDYLDLLRIEPQIGRGIRPEDEEEGAPGVVLLSNSLWQSRFGGDSNVLGKVLMLNGVAHTVIGVLPGKFAFPEGSTMWTALQYDSRARRGNFFLDVLARLGPGITLEDARREMDALAAQIAGEYPDTNEDLGAHVMSMREDLTEEYVEPVIIFLGVVTLVLLLACANVANLLLSRAAAREREIAVRVTLGAGRGRVVRQLLTESVMLALIGGVLGMVLGIIGRDMIIRYIPDEIPYYLEFAMNGWVLFILVGVTAICGILFGMAPAVETMRSDLNQALTEGSGRTSGSSRLSWFRSVLVVLEIALALIVLTGAGLMIKGFLGIYSVDPGFDPDNKLTMNISLPQTEYAEEYRQREFFESVIDRLEMVPGITGAALNSELPMSGWNAATGLTIEGVEPDPDAGPLISNRRVVSADYFSVMDIPLVSGRYFDDRDTRDGLRVALINEMLAGQFWPGENPVGRQIAFAQEPGPGDWLTIVGVVGDVRQSGLNRPIARCVYTPHSQWNVSRFFIVINTGHNPLEMVEPVRRAIWSVDPRIPVQDLRTMRQMMRQRSWEEPLYTMLFGIFSVIALVLASVGVYGVIAYSVSQRTREFGIRMALGADGGKVMKLVVGKGMILGVIGIVPSVVIAFFAMRVLGSLLYGIKHDDLTVYAIVVVLLTGVSLAASWLPARRATKVDPVNALRSE